MKKKLKEYYDSAIALQSFPDHLIFGTMTSEKITYDDLDQNQQDIFYQNSFLDEAYKSNIDSPEGRVNLLQKSERLNMTYCVSKEFGGRYSSVVKAFAQAAASWESVSDVKFEHISAKDDQCNESTDVSFDIRPSKLRKYYARAFFPRDDRLYRNVRIDDLAFEPLPGKLTLTGILKHEIGHILAFRHEQISPDPGKCYEFEPWIQLNDVDEFSIMGYADCNTNKSWSVELTAQDETSAACLYGPPLGKRFDKSQCNWRHK